MEENYEKMYGMELSNVAVMKSLTTVTFRKLFLL